MFFLLRTKHLLEGRCLGFFSVVFVRADVHGSGSQWFDRWVDRLEIIRIDFHEGM